MNKKKISLIPIFILLAVGIGTYFTLFTDLDIFNIEKSPEVRRINGFPTISYTDNDKEKVRAIITTQDELSEFLNAVDDSGYVIMREEINFDKELILAVASSTNQFEGHEIKIRKLYEDKEENILLVSVRETELAENCTDRIENSNIAVDLVAISNTTREIEFERVKEIIECNVE